ncbi:gliding motility-associated C-terminal domain-containing protein [Flavobacterium gyeonganense]|uniref:Gliding motility-associated C-terminal domain-containing protein n=1 Tax=Flavobacterium gyeonganense TaxID=1310418 RepID=A0ABV5H8V7_9FLAO|nr:gliding motility-associated C-terminal domain-containing protein [Flavobacterium gyeonganense]
MIKKYFLLIGFNTYFLVFFLNPTKVFSQCAGVDSSVPFEVCDIPNITSQAIDLFPLLGVTAVPGGTWSDDDNSGGLNETTGILNAQIIPFKGIYHYTYTVAGINGCTDNSATIEVIIGGYAGFAEKASACSDDTAFNLFQIFNGDSHLSPQSGGSWYNDTNQTASSSVINAKTFVPGTYKFTYSIAAIGSCPAVSSTGFVTVFRSPEPGTPAPLILCEDSDFSVYSNLDLNDRLSGQDPGGTWTDNNGTGQITFIKDHNINVQQIFNTYGIGEYEFTYTVLPTSPVCNKETAVVRIKIEKKYDFTGAKLEVRNDICESEIQTATYTAILTQGIQNIPNGQFYVTYNVSGPNGETKRVLTTFSNGVLTFPLSRNYFQQPGSFTVRITKIDESSSEGGCVNIINDLSDVLHVYKTPVLNGAVFTLTTACQNKSSQASISNASGLEDGTYIIKYNVSGSNTATGQTATIEVLGGNANFTIPSNLNANSGNSIIIITNVTNAATPYCTNTANLIGNLIINKLPDASNLKVEVLDDCINKPFKASVSGLGTLTNVTISYLLSGSNTAALQTISLAATNGKADFIIPAVLLPNTGPTAISIVNLVNNDNSCDVNLTTVSDAFVLNPIPVAPTAADRSFCKIERATIANLVPNGSQYKWYNSSALTTPLANTYVLKTEDYWLTETSAAGCTSPATMIKVTVSDSPAPVLDVDGQNFCGLENPAILDLSNNTNVASTVVWYDALSNGNLLAASTPLTDNTTYYGFDISTSTNCISEDHLEVKVSLSHCDETEYETFFVPDGFSPNGDNVNDTFKILKIDFLYPNYSLEIYNRYGNVMFKGNRNKPDWDGRNLEGGGFGDGVAPNGVYFYVIHFNKDNKPPQQGRLYLNR